MDGDNNAPCFSLAGLVLLSALEEMGIGLPDSKSCMIVTPLFLSLHTGKLYPLFAT